MKSISSMVRGETKLDDGGVSVGNEQQVMNLIENFHHPENFSNILESLVTKSIMSSPKESSVIKSIFGHQELVRYPHSCIRI